MSRRILAIDTTAEFGSIAIGAEEVLLHAPGGFGGVIFEHIERLLQRVELRLDDLDGFAAASGPGSFTGVRIGLACAKGFAEATGKPAFAVSNLAALTRFGKSEKRVAVIDARRGEVYAAVDGVEMVCPFPTLLAQLSIPNVEFISQNFEPFLAFIANTPFADCRVTTAPQALAATVAQIASERLGSGDSGDPAGVDANYVRRSDAELLFKPW